MNYRGFHQTYKVFPCAFFKPELEYQGKIILPPSALEIMSHLNLEYPLLFELTSTKSPTRKVHAGVLEFLAEEGKVYIPFWMMQNIGVDTGDFMKVSTTSLPRATYVKIQPQSTSFLDISNPKAVLENTLRNFSALTQGETIFFSYNSKDFHVSVLEIKPANPSNGVSIIETDMEVEFAAPIGYEEKITQPTTTTQQQQQQQQPSDGLVFGRNEAGTKNVQEKEATEAKEEGKFAAFSGAGYSLKSTKSTNNNNNNNNNNANLVTNNKNVNNEKKVEEEEDEEDDENDTKSKFVAFSGKGYSLK